MIYRHKSVYDYLSKREKEITNDLFDGDVCRSGYFGGRLKAIYDLRITAIEDLLLEYKRFPDMETSIRIGYKMEIKQFNKFLKKGL